MCTDNQRIAKIENITNLATLTPNNITKYLQDASLITTNQNDLQNVLRCGNNITKYFLLVFEAHKYSTKGWLMWSIIDKGAYVALLIRDMGLIYPFSANYLNVHLGTQCRNWEPNGAYHT